MKKFLRRIVIAGSVCLLVVSCATTRTKLTKTWTDESYQGSKFTDVMVIGVTEVEATRRSFENRFVNRLKATGIEAVSSAAVLPSETKLDKDKIVSEIKRRGVDAVLVTHLVEVEEEEISSPLTTQARPDDYHGGYVEAYAAAYDSVHHPEYTVKVKVRLETKLYDAKADKLIWSAESTTMQAGSDAEAMNSVIDALVKDLQKSKLLP
jgi:hypothetical protein